MALYNGIITVTFARSTENWKMKADDANYSITIDGNGDNSYFISTDQLESSKQFSSSFPCFLDGIPGKARGGHH